MQGDLAPVLDWKGDVLASRSRQAWPGKILSPLGGACPIDQPEERKQSMIEAFLPLTALME
jgi:hypothetical protein